MKRNDDERRYVVGDLKSLRDNQSETEDGTNN